MKKPTHSNYFLNLYFKSYVGFAQLLYQRNQRTMQVCWLIIYGVRSCIAREIRNEQVQQDNKKMTSVVKGSCPSESFNHHDLLKEINSEIGSSVDDQDFETKRIGKIHESNGRQLLLIKFKDAMKRKDILGNSIKLRVSSKYHNKFLDPDLTKSEREAQYQLRVEKRTLAQKYSDKKFIIKNDRVIE